jgi:hypothetical protein
MAHHTETRLAEVGFLRILFLGIWLVAAQIPQAGHRQVIVAGDRARGRRSLAGLRPN